MILDTNALSAVADHGSGAVRQFLAADQIAIPVIVLGEYRFGIARSRLRAEYERWLSGLLERVSVLNVDEETSLQYASLRLELNAVGRPMPSNDTWIAALCRQHRMPVMSNDRHFDQVRGLKRIGW